MSLYRIYLLSVSPHNYLLYRPKLYPGNIKSNKGSDTQANIASQKKVIPNYLTIHDITVSKGSIYEYFSLTKFLILLLYFRQ